MMSLSFSRNMTWLPILPLVVSYSIILLLFLLYKRVRPVTFKAKCTPPCPRKLPFIGNLHQLGSLPHRSLSNMADKHGPIMLLRLGQVPALVVSTADLAAEILKRQDHIFSNRPSLKVPKKLFYGGKDIAFAPYGEYWRQMKKLSVLHLLSAKMVKSFSSLREEEVARMVKTVLNEYRLGSVDLTRILGALSRHVISKVTIGWPSREDEWDGVMHGMIKDCSVMLASSNPGDYFPLFPWLSKIIGLDWKLNATFEGVDRILDGVIEKRAARSRNGERESECFIDILLSLMEEKTMELPFGKDNIKAIVTDLFGAGTDSNSITMEWIMAELVRNPMVMNKLQEEIRNITGRKLLVQEEDLNKMPYLKAVIKEAFRLHPPGPLLVPRELTQDTNIRGYNIPRGALVLVNVWAIGRDVKIWDAPDEFRPERFVGSKVDYKGHDFELLPFGAGRRVCPGIEFAMSLVELAVANLLLRFDWSLPNGGKGEEIDMDEVYGQTVRKKTGLHLAAKPYIV